MILQVWGSAAAIVVASVLIGQALTLLGLRCRAAGPAVGLSALIVICAVAIKLPGRGTTAAVVALVFVLAAAAVVTRAAPAGGRPRPVTWAVAGATLLLAAIGAAIPFIANGEVGLQGVSLDNDTANHMMWAQTLRSPVVGTRYGSPGGYPLGPHSLADAVASGLGLRLDVAFTGLLIAIVLTAALVGAASLPGDAPWKKPIAGVLAALMYMAAAYYAEAAFKESLLGMILLATVLHLEGLRAGWEPGTRRRWLSLLPLSILFAASVYIYSYIALVWIVLTIGIWVAAEVVMHPRWVRAWKVRVRDLGIPAVIAAAVFVVVLLPQAGPLINFANTVGVSPAGSGAITTSNTGNLAYGLSPYQAMGLWNAPDFRLRPPDEFHLGLLAAGGLLAMIFGLVWSVRRRELILPAAVVACWIVFWRSEHGQSIYVTAKALVIATPVIAVTDIRGLLRAPIPALSRWTGGARALGAAGFVIAACYCSYLALRDEPVWSPASTNQLLSLASVTRGQPVLFLGASDYADWIFSTSEMSALSPVSVSMAQAYPRPSKLNVYGTAFDFDSIDPNTINRLTYFVTSNTTYASQPPAGVVLVRRTPMYELWRRTATIAPRQALDPPNQPGAILNCATKAGRALSRRRGTAAIMAKPVVATLTGVAPGASETAKLNLPAGTWDLSIQYESPISLQVVSGSDRWPMPAYDDRPGPFFAVGAVTSTGTAPVAVTIKAVRPSPLTGQILAANLAALAAVRSPDTRTLVPMRKACGHYVDWFRLGA